MALQGTLETFSVPEVLRLLAGTKKTGLLALEGDRGVGNVWFTDGRIAAASSEHEQGDRIEPVLFDLLRFDRGSFVFEPDSRPEHEATHDADVEEVLGEAERLLGEWREIESVVPSLDVRVHLVDELDGESVVVTAGQWKSLALIGSGISARRIGAHLDLGEFDTCNLVRGLVEAGLVVVTEDAAPEPVSEPTSGPISGPAPVTEHDLSHDEVASLGENLAGFVAGTAESDEVEPGAHELTDLEPAAEFEPETVVEPEPVVEPESFEVAEPEPFVEREPFVEPEPFAEPEPVLATAESLADAEIEPEDFLSQLSNLSPKAAAAIEATADDDADGTAAETPADTAGAPVTSAGDADRADGDEEINRNLLLKFLSSAKN